MHSVSRRRLFAAALVGLAAICALRVLRPPAVPTRPVWVAAHDLTGGRPIASGDVRVEHLPSADVPEHAITAATSPVGRILAAPVRRTEPLTDVRLLGTSLLTAIDAPDAVVVPVRVTDGAASIALVHAGDAVDIIAVSDPSLASTDAGSTVVHDVRVLATPTPEASDPTGDAGGVLIVAASPQQAAALAAAATGSQLSVAVRRST
jgi:Flp pilus assembly protein CpaB